MKLKLNMKHLLTLSFAFSIFFTFTLPAFGEEAKPAGHGGNKFDLSAVLVHHLMDAPIFEWQPGGTKIRSNDPSYKDAMFERRYTFYDSEGPYKYKGGLPLHITKRVMMMFIVSAILVLVMVTGARMIASNPYSVKSRFASFVEAMVQFVRVDVVGKNVAHGHGLEPLILALFFFILFLNVFGLFPPFGEMIEKTVGAFSGHHADAAHHAVSPLIAIWPGITVTGDVAVTLTLSVITTLMVWIVGFKYQGASFLVSCVPSSMPKALAIPFFFVLFPLELIVGPLAKGFALTIRLLANMTAGHVIILALLGFIFQFQSLFVAPVSILGAGAIYMLELFVACLQAFIFALLSTIFISSSMHRH